MDKKAVGPTKKQLPEIQTAVVNGRACSNLSGQAYASDQIVVPSYCGAERFKAFGVFTL